MVSQTKDHCRLTYVSQHRPLTQASVLVQQLQHTSNTVLALWGTRQSVSIATYMKIKYSNNNFAVVKKKLLIASIPLSLTVLQGCMNDQLQC